MAPVEPYTPSTVSYNPDNLLQPLYTLHIMPPQSATWTVLNWPKSINNIPFDTVNPVEANESKSINTSSRFTDRSLTDAGFFFLEPDSNAKMVVLCPIAEISCWYSKSDNFYDPENYTCKVFPSEFFSWLPGRASEKLHLNHVTQKPFTVTKTNEILLS